jgi:hypothetical protein
MMKTNILLQCSRVASIFIVLVVLLPFPLSASPLELTILFDITKSCSHVFEDNKAGVEDILHHLPDGTCVMIIGITEKSFSEPLKLLDRHCIPVSEYKFDKYYTMRSLPHVLITATHRVNALWCRNEFIYTRPFEVRKRILSEWRKNIQSHSADRRFTDDLGAFCLAGLHFSASDKNGKHEKILIVFSDMRHNTNGINISGAAEIPKDLLSKVRAQELIARLEGVRIWVLGVHTEDKNQRYFNSLERFWVNYFKESGASLEIFSPDSKCSPGDRLKISE